MVAQPLNRGRLSAVVLAGVVLGLIGCQAPASNEPSSATSGEPSANPSGSGAAGPAVVDAVTATTYDVSQPVDLVEGEVETRESGVTVTDINFASATGERATAWLVVPPGDGPFAGLVYLHGSETNRNDFLDEAEAMATGGAVSIVLDAPFSRTGTDRRAYLLSWGLPERERDMTAQTVIDVRRAYDILAARGDVDPARLGYVGHSWGANAGAVLGAVDARPVGLVLLAPRPSWTEFLETYGREFAAGAKSLVGEERFQQYLEVMAPFDALAVTDQLSGERLYLQFGSIDDVVPPDVAQELIDALPEATVDFYDAQHALDDQATADRVAWLVEKLGMQPISPEVLATVGLPDQ